MAEVTATFHLGAETVTSVLDVDLGPVETILTGDIDAVVPAGTVARLRGSCRLINNLHVRGTLLCDETGVELDGQDLFDIHTHDGTLNLVGVEKTAWCRWGDAPVGWEIGDRLAIAPTAAGIYVASEGLWTGDWDTMIRPANSPNVNLPPNPYLAVARPEVANLSQTVTLRNLKRIMIHEASAPNPQTFKWIRVLDSGEAGVLTNYPIHFHLIGEHARGSLLEGVVVEGGKNHAFVPHGSHGISFPGCVAYNTKGVAFWWDRPMGDPLNNSDDINWDDCLSLGSFNSSAAGESTRLAGFWLGAGTGNTCNRSVAVGVPGNATGGPRQRSGFHWPEQATKQPWGFDGAVAHNNVENGILVWQNAEEIVNPILNFVAYNHGYADVHHGAYSNRYHYDGAVLNSTGMRVRAKTPGQPGTPLVLENVHSAGPLVIGEHQSSSMLPSYYRTSSYPQVVYDEPSHGSFNIYEDCGLVPADFTFTDIAAGSIIEIYEGDVLTHRWVSGVWS